MDRSTPLGAHAALSDEALIQQVYPSQPDQCVQSLYRRYATKVYWRCLSMTKDEDKAQAFTQDIFLKVFHKLDAFEARSRFSRWLYSIADTYCAAQLRPGRRLSATRLAAALAADPTDPQAYWQAETQRVVKRALAMLRVEDRQLLRLKYEDGLSMVAIAQLLAVQAVTVKMRLMRSRETIKRLADSLLS